MSNRTFNMQMTPATAPAFSAFAQDSSENTLSGTAFAVSVFVLSVLVSLVLHSLIVLPILVLLGIGKSASKVKRDS